MPAKLRGSDRGSRDRQSEPNRPSHLRRLQHSYKRDEEYYVAAFGCDADSPAGRAVTIDWRRGLAKGTMGAC